MAKINNSGNNRFCHWDFDRDCIDSVVYFGKKGHFNNIISSNT